MKRKLLTTALTLALTVTTLGAGLTLNVNAADTSGNGKLMYRLYNPNSGEHFYTADESEKNLLDDIGWNWENYGWIASENGNPVYRLYNQYAGDHHYTMSEAEKDMLVSVGWDYEGIGWYSTQTEDEDTTPLFRLYNPNATGAGSHHYTMSADEKDHLASIGWNYEGTCWMSNYDISVSNFVEATCTEAGSSGDVVNKRTGEVLYAGEVIDINPDNHVHTVYYPETSDERCSAQRCNICGEIFWVAPDNNGSVATYDDIFSHLSTHGLNYTQAGVNSSMEAWDDFASKTTRIRPYYVVTPAHTHCTDCGKDF